MFTIFFSEITIAGVELVGLRKLELYTNNMAQAVKINDNSICTGCSDTPPPDQRILCFTCKHSFHAVCEAVDKDHMVGTKTMVKLFLGGSTKSNFKFFCDVCLTNMEKGLVQTEGQKIVGLEKKVSKMEGKLDEIVKLLKNSNSSNDQPKMPAQTKPIISSLWNDKEKLRTVKAPPEKSVLVIKSSNNSERNVSNQDKVEKAIKDHNIDISESYKNKAGDIVVVCETPETRDELKNVVASTDQHIEMNSPAEKRQSITIVGLPKEYQKDEVIQMLQLQNGFIKGFARNNDINNHIEIFAIKCLKNDESKFQAFASVSSTLREGLNYFGNKVTLGLSTCKVYDQFHVKRCYNCQQFGHYKRDCPTPQSHVCGKCSENHATNTCTSNSSKCINCVKEKITGNNHHTSSIKCPCVIKQQNILKNRHYTLNMRTMIYPPPH